MLPGLSSPPVAFQSLTRQPVTTIRPNLPTFPPRRLTFPCYQGHAGPMEKLGVSRRNQSALGGPGNEILPPPSFRRVHVGESDDAGSALEQATHDESVRVRFQARTLLWQYHLAGYRGGKTPDISGSGNMIRTEEPPLAPPLEANRGSKIDDRESSVDVPSSTFRPRSSVLDPRTAAPSPIVVIPPPTVGYVAPATPAAPTKKN